MIKRDTFIDVMTRLQDFEEKVTELDNALRNISTDNEGGAFITEPTCIVLDVMKEVFHDDDDDFSYLMYEKEFYKKDRMRAVTMDLELVDLSDWGKVYDYFVSRLNG